MKASESGWAARTGAPDLIVTEVRRSDHDISQTDKRPSKPVGVSKVLRQVKMVMQQLEAQLPPEVFAAAIARGRARQIDEVVAELIGDKT